MTKPKKVSCGELVGMMAVSVAIVPVAVVWRAWVLAKLWGWFVVGVLPLPALTIGQAAGVAVVAGMLTHSPTTAKEKTREGWEGVLYGCALAILWPAFMLGSGAIVRAIW